MDTRRRYVQYLVAASVSIASMTVGVISGWTTPVISKFHANETDVNITDGEISWMVAMSSPGIIVGSLVTRFVSDFYGRKKTILGSALPLVLGAILLLSSVVSWWIYLAKFLWGWGTGMLGTVVGMYLAEIADKEVRGTLSGGSRFMFNLGALLAIAVGPFFSYQTLNICLLVLPLVFYVLCWWIPETPYYYLKEGKIEQARRALVKLRNHKDKKEVEEELSQLRSSVATDMSKDSSVKELFSGVQYRKAIIIAAGLKLTQIMSGVVTVQQYLGRIMQDTKSNITLSTVFIIFGAVRFFVGIMSSILVDRLGRRPLLIYSYFGTAFCHALAGGYFFCQEVLKIDQSVLALYGYVPFAGIIGSSIISTLGFTSIIFVVSGEIFPMNVKAVAMSSISIYGGVLSFIVGKGYQHLKDFTGLCGVFWIFAGITALGAIFTLSYVPETKGKSLSEIQVLLQGDMYNENIELEDIENMTKSLKDISESQDLKPVQKHC